MIRIAAVDDEYHVLERFERMIAEFKEVELCGLFETADQLLSYLEGHTLDAVFLDIEMPQVNGLELSAQLLERYEHLEIVFVTAYNQYAVEAFEVNAMDYILKPMSQDRLGKIINRLLKTIKPAKPSVKPFIQCIGDFEVILSTEVLTWKNSKAKEILGFLVQKNGTPVNWEKIADAIWPEYHVEKAHTNFHANMYLLRKRMTEAGISEILDCRRGNYRIVTDKVTCDLYQLETLVKENKVKRKEDLELVKQLKQKGYMYASGYTWAQPKAAELEEVCDLIFNL